ncbi:rCG26245 [Rattus norvegicus]|uniref:RCG26245 n=1 Tax=Rattus norvegicus TaxID=10116 RepID=A6HP12_RAT|nr:rCG26245 [Rattus norvegicus]
MECSLTSRAEGSTFSGVLFLFNFKRCWSIKQNHVQIPDYLTALLS